MSSAVTGGTFSGGGGVKAAGGGVSEKRHTPGQERRYRSKPELDRRVGPEQGSSQVPVYAGTVPRLWHRWGQHAAIGEAGFKADAFACLKDTNILAPLDQYLCRRQANNSATYYQCLHRD